MGYAEYLKTLLAPLHIYELDAGYSAAEIDTLGKSLDTCCVYFEESHRESVIQTAESFGLYEYETIMPYIPAYADLESRRNALMALLQTDETCFTASALNRIISSCGISATVEEMDVWYTVRIQFPGTIGIPSNFEAVKRRIEQVIPCHLNIRYDLVLTKWDDLEADFKTIGAPFSAEMTFEDMELYKIVTE
jgi:hypothetical protein